MYHAYEQNFTICMVVLLYYRFTISFFFCQMHSEWKKVTYSLYAFCVIKTVLTKRFI